LKEWKGQIKPYSVDVIRRLRERLPNKIWVIRYNWETGETQILFNEEVDESEIQSAKNSLDL